MPGPDSCGHIAGLRERFRAQARRKGGNFPILKTSRQVRDSGSQRYKFRGQRSG